MTQSSCKWKRAKSKWKRRKVQMRAAVNCTDMDGCFRHSQGDEARLLPALPAVTSRWQLAFSDCGNIYTKEVSKCYGSHFQRLHCWLSKIQKGNIKIYFHLKGVACLQSLWIGENIKLVSTSEDSPIQEMHSFYHWWMRNISSGNSGAERNISWWI